MTVTKLINMSYLTHLKRSAHCQTCRWVIKRDLKDKITEVKLIYCPEEYALRDNARPLLTRDMVVIQLELEKNKN